MKIKGIIQNIRVAIRTKKSILADLDQAVVDYENLSKLMEGTKAELLSVSEQRDRYYKYWTTSIYEQGDDTKSNIARIDDSLARAHPADCFPTCIKPDTIQEPETQSQPLKPRASA